MNVLVFAAAFSLICSPGTMEDEVRKIHKEVVINAPLETVWQTWTTVEGLQTFFGPEAHIELKLGGIFEIYFYPENPPDQRGAEELVVLDFEPMESLTFSWSAPPSWPSLRKERTRVTVRLEAIDSGSTRVVLIHDRWGEGELNGEKWDEVFDYFQNAWNVILKRLLWSFENGPIDWQNRDIALKKVNDSQISDVVAR